MLVAISLTHMSLAYICFSFFLAYSNGEDRQTAKIVQGVDIMNPTATASTVYQQEVPFEEPKSPFYGPEVLSVLYGQCFHASFDRCVFSPPKYL